MELSTEVAGEDDDSDCRGVGARYWSEDTGETVTPSFPFALAATDQNEVVAILGVFSYHPGLVSAGQPVFELICCGSAWDPD